MTEIDDKLLKQFFKEQKQQIKDNGFSRGVIRHLPDRTKQLADLWTFICSVCAMILLFAFDGFKVIAQALDATFTLMIEQNDTTLDPQSLLIAAAVLIFFGVSKVCSIK